MHIGRFGFFGEGIDFGRAALSAPQLRQADLIVGDEVGPWELEGDGWAKELDWLSILAVPMVMTVRTSLGDEVTRRWGKRESAILPVRTAGLQQMLAALQTPYPA